MGRMVSSIALPTAATSMALIHGFCNRALKKGEVAPRLAVRKSRPDYT